MEVTIPNGFTPRGYQGRFMAYFDAGGKRACWVVHRRGGKDLTALHQTCKMALKRKGVYWHIFPTLEQGRKAIWEGFTRDGDRIMEQVFPRAIRKRPREWLPGAEAIVELDAKGKTKTLASWKAQDRTTVDAEALRAAMPDVAAQFSKTTTSRVLRVN